MKLQLAPLHLPLAEGARLCPIVSRRSRVGEEAEWDHVRFTNTGKGNKGYFAFYFFDMGFLIKTQLPCFSIQSSV